MGVWASSRLTGHSVLTGAWKRALTDGRMGVVVIRGPGGSGRTSLLRALYAHCALDQRYWPAILPTAGPDVSPTLRREIDTVVVPDPFRVPDE